MSTKPASIRRWGLLIGAVFAVAATVVSLGQTEQRIVASLEPRAAGQPAMATVDRPLLSNVLTAGDVRASFQQSDPASTAVLFLIDESGGVSGRCSNVDSTKVFVTDDQGRRYDLVRFYLQLWRAYYHFMAEHVQSDSISPVIQVGIGQFAKENELKWFLPLSKVQDLGYKGAEKFEELKDQNRMLAGFDADWFCWTSFKPALEAALQELENSGSANKVLVLLTDGSSKGDERAQETEAVRTNARNNTKLALESLKKTGINVVVVLLGGNDCPDGTDCGLQGDEPKFRDQDLTLWKGWEAEGLLTLIPDDAQAIRQLAETKVMEPLMPGYGLPFSGWLDQSNKFTIKPDENKFPAVTEELTMIVVTSREVETGAFKTDYVPLMRFRPQWYRGTGKVTMPTGVCLDTEIGISIDDERVGIDPLVAYYWLVPVQGWPRIKSVEVQPNLVVIDRLVAGHIPSAARSVTVTVNYDARSFPSHATCYKIQIRAGPTAVSREMAAVYGPEVFRIEFPEDIPYGPVPITATLVFANKPDQVAALPKTTSTSVKYWPVLPEVIDVSATFAAAALQGLTVTVPITFAAQVPGFDVGFGLFPDRFDLAGPFPTPPTLPTSIPGKDCPPTRKLDDAKAYLGPVTKAIDAANSRVTNYTFVIPDPEIALKLCGYQSLVAQWSNADGQEIDHWIDIKGVPISLFDPCDSWLCELWSKVKSWFSGIFSSRRVP